MSMLDNLCRLCSEKLDPSVSLNIFAPENSHILKLLRQVIPLPMDVDDAYPNHACDNCVCKVQRVFHFQQRIQFSMRKMNRMSRDGSSLKARKQ